MVATAFGERSWQAEDADHAREQHLDAFGGQVDEDIEWIEAIVCISGPGGCTGAVEFHSSGRGGGAWPRCARHAEERLDHERDATYRLGNPDSPVPPVGFAPEDAGETWEER